MTTKRTKTNDREQQLEAALANHDRVHAEWVADQNREYPDDRYEEAIDLLDSVFGEGDLPALYNDVAGHLDRFVLAWDEFLNVRDMGGDPNPPQAVWEAREAMVKAWKAIPAKVAAPGLRELESIAQLREQKVDDRQIAKMWGFVDADGEPLVHLVQREFEKPGSVTQTPGSLQGRDWVHPDIRQQQAAQEALNERIDTLMAEHEAEQRQAEACPETDRDLWEQKVPIAQAAKMLGRAIEDVAQAFEAFDAERELIEKERAAEDAARALEASKKGKKKEAVA